MKLVSAAIDGVMIIEPDVYRDSRGFFMETYQRRRYLSEGVSETFVQDNLSHSVRNTLRGLHYQIRKPQAKLVQVLAGEIFDVVVDLRPESETFGKWETVHLSGENCRQLFIPAGLAHGFCVLSDTALFLYKCSDFYDPEDEAGVLWNDPDIGIVWPVDRPILSEKDRGHPLLKDLSPNRLPRSRQ